MELKTDNSFEMGNKGKVSCNRNILLSIINLAAKEIAGVASLVANFGSGLAKVFSNNYYEGVKIGYNSEGVDIDIYLNIQYGYNVSDVAYRVQENVKNSVASMMDVSVVTVNIHVMGVNFPKEEI